MSAKKHPRRIANHPILKGIRHSCNPPLSEGRELELSVAIFDEHDHVVATVDLADPRVEFVKAFNKLMAETGDPRRAEAIDPYYVAELQLQVVRDNPW